MNLTKFISDFVVKREESMFLTDLKSNNAILFERISKKSVLVIGGAGTIGSSFIKAILKYKPESLIVVDINENGLTELTRDLRSSNLEMPSEYITYPMNYSDSVFFKMFKQRKGFDIVANFSAHKHVRSEKDIFSIEALLRNNVINAKKLLNLLNKYPPERFFCVSTDKAANPVNIMGASKKIMEEMIMSYSTKFTITTARFANVAFSNGSLPEGFINRINKKQPITAPKDIRRFFVSPEESGQICLLACVLGNSGDIFFPKLGEQDMTTFDKISNNLIHEMGYSVKYCESEDDAKKSIKNLSTKSYPVFYSKSDTSGEKLYEEFYTDDEKIDLNKFNALGVIHSLKTKSISEIENFILKLDKDLNNSNNSKSDIVNTIKEFLTNFNHIETEKNLDSKM